VQTQYLSPADAGSISKCLGQLLTAGTISHREYAIGQCLLWRVRKSGQAIATASYTLLGRLAHVSRKIGYSPQAPQPRPDRNTEGPGTGVLGWIRRLPASHVQLSPDSQHRVPAGTHH
jgi:hypothetical protein